MALACEALFAHAFLLSRVTGHISPVLGTLSRFKPCLHTRAFKVASPRP